MKWIKASERLPANAASTITRWYHNGEKIELMSAHYIKDWAKLNKIELDDIEWLDENNDMLKAFGFWLRDKYGDINGVAMDVVLEDFLLEQKYKIGE